MNDATMVRRTSADRLAGIWEQEPGLLAILLLGSAAAGTCDDASDVDLALYWEAVPSRERLDQIKATHGTGERVFFFGDPAEGGCVESYRIGGIRHDFAHVTLPLWHAQTDEVLEHLNLDSLWQKGMYGTLHGTVLRGGEVVEGLRARLREYPETLRQAMLSRYCQFSPHWTAEHQARGRADFLFYYELLVQLQRNLLFTLCAVNGVYHAMEFKRLHRFVAEELPLAPCNLAARLDSLLTADPRIAAADLAPLVEETLDIVAAHSPGFAVEPVRARWRLAGR